MNGGQKLPTQVTYHELQLAYEFFNERLFAGRLPSCLITLQREKHTFGYFSPNRFVSRSEGKFTDEIAMNPSYYGVRPIREILSTLVHEMTHLEQHHFGKPGRGRYHNKEWGQLMLAVGLHPSNTGKPGGKVTGDQMWHFIIEGGVFDKACDELITKDFTLSWIDRFPPVRPTSPGGLRLTGSDDDNELSGSNEDNDDDDHSSSMGYGVDTSTFSLVFPPEEGKETRQKYQCANCDDAVWGKKNLTILCGKCEGNPPFAPVLSKRKQRNGHDEY
ncbi:SprT-like domain-containing protein [Acinetobacter variabilis]|uniref:SprT-like domain-containing protein n=1 Tax=Acinetobacter variabilis TaxID=70346 RepID=UPI0028AF9E01|nr:SprT-like domain-containing protein [Acinetobacter variabilis]